MGQQCPELAPTRTHAMIADRFDTLAQSLSHTPSRRTALRLLGGAALGGLFTLGTGRTEAKRGGHGKGKGTNKKGKKGKCTKKLPDGTACAGGTCQRGSCVAAVPDPCARCSGDEVCSGGACLVPACGAGGPCRVFLSSIRYDGNLGGLNGADAKCQDLANAAGLPGSYKAWLSDSTSSPSSRFVPSTGPYRLVTGTTIAANWTDLTDGPLLAPITVTETGGGFGSSERVWTHSLSNGNAGADPGAHCANWSTNGPGAEGKDGSATNIDLG